MMTSDGCGVYTQSKKNIRNGGHLFRAGMTAQLTCIYGNVGLSYAVPAISFELGNGFPLARAESIICDNMMIARYRNDSQ